MWNRFELGMEFYRISSIVTIALLAFCIKHCVQRSVLITTLMGVHIFYMALLRQSIEDNIFTKQLFYSNFVSEKCWLYD